MFFWGGYSFQLPQQQEHPDKPPLKYPLYVPPAPSFLARRPLSALTTNCPSVHDNNENEEEEAGEDQRRKLEPKEAQFLSQLEQHHLPVRDIACGLKHAIIVVEEKADKEKDSSDNDSSANNNEENEQTGSHAHPQQRRKTTLYGLGSNHNGQLGRRVATYTNTLTPLSAPHEGFDEDVIISVACGLRHSLIATNKGCVYVSGDNSYGQLGLSSASLASYFKSKGRGGGGGVDGKGGEGGGGAGGGGGASASALGGLNSGAAGGGTGKGGKGNESIADFTQVTSLVHIRRVYASHNASFALDAKGNVYSWGDAQHGHLGHGDHIVADEKGGLDKVANVLQPRLLRWFEKHRVRIGECAVGKGHALFVSQDGEDVYTCGEGFFGKLGHGSIDSEFEPRRLETFPERKQKERVLSIAAGDDCSLVLKANPSIGSVVYFFGKLTNGDGQLKPFIISFPYANIARPPPAADWDYSPLSSSLLTVQPTASLYSDVTNHTVMLRKVACGRGNQCLATSADGRLFVWGKHTYTRLANGTDADAVRGQPTPIASLEKYVLEGAATGGTFMMAWGSQLRESPAAADAEEANPAEKKLNLEDEEESKKEGEAHAAASAAAARTHPGHVWDVIVPQDSRVGRGAPGKANKDATADEREEDEDYEEGVRLFLQQYLGPQHAAAAEAYLAAMPAAPPRTAKAVYAYTKLPTSELAVGQKVRLWMTNLYALGTITKVDAQDRDNLAAAAAVRSPPTQAGQKRGRSQSLSSHQPSSSSLLPPTALSQAGGSTLGHSVRSQQQQQHPHLQSQNEEAKEEEAVDGGGNSGIHHRETAVGRRVCIAWERDDWRDEVVTLYSDDETLSGDNENRWQPFWFERNETGDYVIAKSR